eukprot:m.59830 g.59830  ORF g.59830 m.59830 type:complete len:547 (+) comp13249_c0_seq3:238-1878(+)
MRWSVVLISAAVCLSSLNIFLLVSLHGSSPSSTSSPSLCSAPSSPQLPSPSFPQHAKHDTSLSEVNNHRPNVHILVRDFDEWANTVASTAVRTADTLSSFAHVEQIVIAYEHIPYPPITLPASYRNHVKIVATKLAVFEDKNSKREARDVTFDDGHVLIVSDGLDIREAGIDVETWLTQHRQLEHNLQRQDRSRCLLTFITVSDIGTEGVPCTNAFFDEKRWTLTVSSHFTSTPPKPTLAPCNYTTDIRMVLLTNGHTLLRLRWDEVSPLSQGLLLQAHMKRCEVQQFFPLRTQIMDRKNEIYTTDHLREKQGRYEAQRIGSLYSQLGIKLIRYPYKAEEHWFGCHKHSSRCFGTVVHDTPEYIFQGRWTPPCCLSNIRKTAQYLFTVLNKANVRYWLEGGTLLGAARHGDIIEWDYDCDVGIFLEDVALVEELKKAAAQGSYESPEGYVWEKAREGDFYRVQFSRYNHLHVDIFPFYERNGVMTKDTWMESHRQDMEFPSSYLKPLETMMFVGMQVKVPNRAREFLELKFGEGCIEHPRLPGPST